MILEAILTAVVLFLVLLMIGVPIATVIGWALIALWVILLLTIALFVLFFLVTGISLLFFRRVKGQFLRMDDSGRFDRAVYLAEGREYTCMFPAESFGRRRIYKENSDARFLLLVPRSNKRSIAYDGHSLVIIAVGIVFSAALVVFVLWGNTLIRQYL